MPVSSQLPLPLPLRHGLSRAELIVTPANAQAVAFVDKWPDWPVAAAAVYGPHGCGKSHLVAIWQEKSGALVLPAVSLSAADARERRALAIEDVDAAQAKPERDAALFAALESARPETPLLLTGREPPLQWPCVLPDLASRFAALAAFPLWAPDDAMLAQLARKLFADRQLLVPDPVIEHMLCLLERSPAAIRDFVAEADAAALASARPINLALVRQLIAAREAGPP